MWDRDAVDNCKLEVSCAVAWNSKSWSYILMPLFEQGENMLLLYTCYFNNNFFTHHL